MNLTEFLIAQGLILVYAAIAAQLISAVRGKYISIEFFTMNPRRKS